MKILSIDTSRSSQSVSVFDTESGVFILSEIFNSKSSQFVPLLITSLERLGLQANNFGLIATTSGPGSFTGIRAGLAIVKTFAAELDLPIFSVNNFELLRFEQDFGGPIAINAGLNDYYISLDTNYNDQQTNYFSNELKGACLVDFRESNISRLIIDYWQQATKPSYVDYKSITAYYLREPSLGLLKKT